MKKYISFAVLFLLFILVFYAASLKTQKPEQEETPVPKPEQGADTAGVFAAFEEKIFDAGIISPDLKIVSPQEQAAGVYSFLQGPKAYAAGLPWSGDWCEKVVGGNKFGGFGCGFCCMANIYSSLTKYECSPWDMYEFAIHSSLYYPTRESGAIGWEDMRTVLREAGFTCKNRLKPKSYKKFKKQIKKAKSAIVLVSSANDNTFWVNTPGHYVNIWLYQEESDMVFLTEPGAPDRNRTWIPLRYVYDALKTVSQYQYLTVDGYSEAKNQWKADGIDDNWNGKFSGIN